MNKINIAFLISTLLLQSCLVSYSEHSQEETAETEQQATEFLAEKKSLNNHSEAPLDIDSTLKTIECIPSFEESSGEILRNLTKVSALHVKEEMEFNEFGHLTIVSPEADGANYGTPLFYGHTYLIQNQEKFNPDGFKVRWVVDPKGKTSQENIALRVFDEDSLPIVEVYFRSSTGNVELITKWDERNNPTTSHILFPYDNTESYEILLELDFFEANLIAQVRSKVGPAQEEKFKSAQYEISSIPEYISTLGFISSKYNATIRNLGILKDEAKKKPVPKTEHRLNF